MNARLLPAPAPTAGKRRAGRPFAGGFFVQDRMNQGFWRQTLLRPGYHWMIGRSFFLSFSVMMYIPFKP